MARSSNLSCLCLCNGDSVSRSWAQGRHIPGCGSPAGVGLYLVEQEWSRSSSRTFPGLLMAPAVSTKSSRGWPLWMGWRVTHLRGDKRLMLPISALILLMLWQAMARLSCPKEQWNCQHQHSPRTMRDAEGVEAVHPALGRHQSPSQWLKGLQDSWRRTLDEGLE